MKEEKSKVLYPLVPIKEMPQAVNQYKHPKLGLHATCGDFFPKYIIYNIPHDKMIFLGNQDYMFFSEADLLALGFEPTFPIESDNGKQEKGTNDWSNVIEIVEQIGLQKISITTGLPRLKKLFMKKEELQKWLSIDINIDWDKKMIEVIGDDDHVYLREKALTDKTSSHIEFLPTVGSIIPSELTNTPFHIMINMAR